MIPFNDFRSGKSGLRPQKTLVSCGQTIMEMEKGRIILDQPRMALTIDRLCYQLIEEFDDFSNTCVIGIQQRGVFLAERILQRLDEAMGVKGVDFGKLDITFYRDDFRRRDKPLEASKTQIDFLVEDKNVILVDDVLYTGRTISAALAALNHYGRPAKVELLVMVDRRFNRHLPVKSTFRGIRVDALDEAYVRVEWEGMEGQDRVLLFGHKNEMEE